MRILYIDDTVYWRETYENAFRISGIEIKTLPDARGDIVNATLEYQPDLILLDISMPEVNGFEAIGFLKGNRETKKIPVFFFSNINNSEYIKQGIALGAEKYLVKGDYETQELVKICSDYLEKATKRR